MTMAMGLSPHRWVAVGISADPHPVRAAEEAVDAALQHEDARLLVLFASDSYDLETLVPAVHARGRGARLVGCSTAGEIATDGPAEASIVVAAFGGPGFSVATGAGHEVTRDLRAAGAEAARTARLEQDCEHTALMLLTDGLAGGQQEIVRGAYSVVGSATPLVGGCAGDDFKMERTHQFLDGRVLRDSVVAAAIGSDAPIGIGVRHGWRRVGPPMVVTGSCGTHVLTLDDRPALDVYLERLGAPGRIDRDRSRAAFSRFASTHPLGLSRRTGEEHVRAVAGADHDERSLSCFADVPTGALVWLMEGDEESVLAATDAAAGAALDALGDCKPLGVLAFDCIARRDVLGSSIKAEVDRLASVCEAPVAGFYTYGEIARTRGLAGFHNQTLVVLAVA